VSQITSFEWVLPKDWWWLPDYEENYDYDAWARELSQRLVPDVDHRKAKVISVGAGFDVAWEKFDDRYVEGMRSAVWMPVAPPWELKGQLFFWVSRDVRLDQMPEKLMAWTNRKTDIIYSSPDPFQASVPAGQVRGIRTAETYLGWDTWSGRDGQSMRDEVVYLGISPVGCLDVLEVRAVCPDGSTWDGTPWNDTMAQMVVDLLSSLTMTTS